MNGQKILEFLFSNLVWMSWNALLALLPFLLAIMLFRKHRKYHASLWVIGFLLFILFLPNAPYLFTDIIHLFEDWQKFNSRQSMFFVTVQYLLLLGVGYYLFSESYARFEKFLIRKPGLSAKLWLRIISFTTISVGVFLGRFPRFNSWDAILRPLDLIESFLTIMNKEAFAFVISFTLLLFCVYRVYEFLIRVSLFLKRK